MHQSPFPEIRGRFVTGRFVALAIVGLLAVSAIGGGGVSAQATNGSNITTDADGSPLVVSNQSRDFTTHSRASVQFNDQRVRPLPNSSTYSNKTSAVVIDRVTVPNGGFVSVAGKQALQNHGLNHYKIGFGNSSYLTPGTHRNVKVELYNTTPKHSDELVAILHNDVDGDHVYEGLYVALKPDERNDIEYFARKNGSIVVANDTATIRPPAPQQATTSNATGAINPPMVDDTVTLPTSTVGGNPSTETVAAKGGSGASQADESSGGLFGGNSLLLIVVGLLVGGGVMALLGRIRRKQS